MTPTLNALIFAPAVFMLPVNTLFLALMAAIGGALLVVSSAIWWASPARWGA